MITWPGLLTTSHDDSVSVAVSQNTTSGDVKDKPPSPHRWDGQHRQYLRKENTTSENNEHSKASETPSAERDPNPHWYPSNSTVSTTLSIYIFSSLRLTVIKILFVDFRQSYKIKPATNSGLSLCIIKGRISQYANKHNIFDFRLWSVFQSPQQESLQLQ